MKVPFGISKARPVAQDTRIFVTEDGAVWQRVNLTHPERRQWVNRKLETDKDGYRRVRVAGKNCPVHRLVYAAFKGALEPGLVVRHMDGNPANNHAGNLRLGTQAENIADKKVHGTHQAGDTHPSSITNSVKVREVKRLLASARRSRSGRMRRGEHLRISAETGVSVHTVRDIYSKGAWACVA